MPQTDPIFPPPNQNFSAVIYFPIPPTNTEDFEINVPSVNELGDCVYTQTILTMNLQDSTTRFADASIAANGYDPLTSISTTGFLLTLIPQANYTSTLNPTATVKV